MSDKKRRFFRLIESYINEYRKDDVEFMYGKGAKIKVHNFTNDTHGKTVLFELIVVLGETINESVMDESLAEVLFSDAMVYFYPEIKKIKYMVRFDV